MSEAPDPRRCPLCGRPNACELAEAAACGREPGNCWCRSERFSAELLARVPPAAQRKACICRACREEAREREEAR